MEVWKDIPGFENYQISNYGNVKSLNYGRTGKTKLLKPTISGKGYLQVRLSKSGKPNALLVHRLVAMAFIQNLNNRKQINHKDENKFNNNANIWSGAIISIIIHITANIIKLLKL